MNTQAVPPRPSRRGAFDALRPVVMAAALLVVLVLAALAAAWLTGGSTAVGFTLTVVAPAGGTLSGNGITCGTGGTTCSTSFKDGQEIQLHAEADDGYMLTGFTGDCASTGRLRLALKQDATCGARFERTSAANSPDSLAPTTGQRSWPLTLTPPEHGTIVTLEGHECGPNKKVCTVEVGDGKLVSLDVLAEPGHRVQSYTGDCVDGTANMTQARSCGVVMVRGEGPAAMVPRPLPPVPGQTRPRTPTNEPSGVTTVRSPQVPPHGSAATTAVPPDRPTVPVSAEPERAEPPSATAPIAPHEGDLAAAEKRANTEIQQVLKAYRSAYERMDIPSMKRIQPQLDVAGHQRRFQELKWVKYTFGGDPQIEDLDVERGTCRAIVDLKTEQEQKSGKKEKPLEGKVSYLLKRIRVTADWEIIQVKYDMNK